jgi:hypothetical protein
VIHARITRCLILLGKNDSPGHFTGIENLSPDDTVDMPGPQCVGMLNVLPTTLIFPGEM